MPVLCIAMYFSAVRVPQFGGRVPVMLGLPPREMRDTITCEAVVTVAGTGGRLPTSPEDGSDTVTVVEVHVT